MLAVQGISRSMASVLLTKGFTVPYSSTQAIQPGPGIPSLGVRLLVGRLLFEETMETIHALGLDVTFLSGDTRKPIVHGSRDKKVDLLDIVDGACDTIYTAQGVLAACGVPDLPHMREVCRANEDKFPDGKPVLSEIQPGKYLKPEGWEGPDHASVAAVHGFQDLKEVQTKLIAHVLRGEDYRY